MQVVREENLMEAGGPVPASVRALSGGDPEGQPETQEEATPQNRSQQLQLGAHIPPVSSLLLLTMLLTLLLAFPARGNMHLQTSCR